MSKWGVGKSKGTMMKATKFSQFLQDREELRFVDRPHWIYILEGVIWSLIIICVGIFINQFVAKNFIYPALNDDFYADGLIVNIAAYAAFFALWGSMFFAACYFISQLIYYLSTYVFASDRRIYYKTGLMRVIVSEISFDEIRKTDINYGLLGRFLGYGKLMMDARFVEDTDLPFTYYPEKFAKLNHHYNDLTTDINLSYVTNGMKEKADQIIPASGEVEEQVESSAKQEDDFADYTFSMREKQKMKEASHEGDPLIDDFVGAVDVQDTDKDKPAQSSFKDMRIE